MPEPNRSARDNITHTTSARIPSAPHCKIINSDFPMFSIKGSIFLKVATKSSSLDLGPNGKFNFVPSASPIPFSCSEPVPGIDSDHLHGYLR